MTERRRSRRFRQEAISARVCLLDRPDLHTEPCALLDISFGGMCVRTGRKLNPGAPCVFLLDLDAPFNDLVMVKARVTWVKPSRKEYLAGAEFTESTKGWLGPEE